MSMLRLDDLLLTRGDEKYAELALFIDLLRALSMIHQTAHWQTNGTNFYSDHLLFQRLYEATDADVDTVAEKTVGLGSNRLVELRYSLENVKRFTDAVDEVTTLGSPDEVSPHVRRALKAENAFLKAGERLMGQLETAGLLTRGVENLLGGILDKHEGHVYLLKQRLGSAV
jgi:DNA-binding ferritin-like protein